MHVSNLCPNLYHYLPTLHHYLVKHSKKNASPEALESDRSQNLLIPLTLADRKQSFSDYHSRDHGHHSANEELSVSPQISETSLKVISLSFIYAYGI